MSLGLPDIGEALGHALEPLLRPLLEVRDTVLTWREDFNAVLLLWLAEAVTYVGDRLGAAIAELFRTQLTQFQHMDAVFNLLTSIPLEWTVFSPAVQTLWGVMTVVFLLFTGPAFAADWAVLMAQRTKGSLFDAVLHSLTQTILGAGLAVFSFVLAALPVFVIVGVAWLLVDGATGLTGMAQAQDPASGLRNGVLLGLYTFCAGMMLFERLCATAMLGFLLATAAWGIGGCFWPAAERFASVWESLYVPTIITVLTQIILCRLGSETINAALLRDSSPDALVVGVSVGIAYLAVAICAPGIIGGAYAAGAIPRFGSRLGRAGSMVAGINHGRVMSAAGGRGPLPTPPTPPVPPPTPPPGGSAGP